MAGELPHQFHVIGCHSPIHARSEVLRDKEFAFIGDCQIQATSPF
ncbi:MAG: hypothetical protein JWR19_2717 [Pedosphaera sp.]|nr:hypothetical protein [Pedosphaera sp.]